jgi:hypothetical protein
MEKSKHGLSAKVATQIGGKYFPIPKNGLHLQQNAESRAEESAKLFVLEWRATGLAAGITQLSSSNSLTIANNADFFPKKISAYLVRKALAGTITQAGSVQLQINSAKGFTTQLKTSSIGAQWTVPAGTGGSDPVTFNCSPECPQIAVNGFEFLGGSDLVINLTAFSFGTTILNDVIEAQIHIEY